MAPEKVCGHCILRSQGAGKISQISGLAEAQSKMGGLVSEVKLPVVGMPKSLSYEGDGYVIIEHNDTNIVRQAAVDLITTVSQLSRPDFRWRLIDGLNPLGSSGRLVFFGGFLQVRF